MVLLRSIFLCRACGVYNHDCGYRHITVPVEVLLLGSLQNVVLDDAAQAKGVVL